MSERVYLDVNRVEGDLRVELDVEHGRVLAARCAGTLFRGFEQILIGRDPLDALAITPRICGICSTTHLAAAVGALEQASGITPAAAGVRIRQLCLLAETVQSDLRQTFLYAAPDFTDPHWAGLTDAARITQAFAQGGVAQREAIEHSRQMVRIVGYLGGQWPHSSYMVPGGVTLPEAGRELIGAQAALATVARWFADTVLGDSLDAFLGLGSAAAFDAWLGQPGRRDAWLPFYDRVLRAAGFDDIGRSVPLLLAAGTAHAALPDAPTALAGGCYDQRTGQAHALQAAAVTEDISHAWFHDGRGAVCAPGDGRTQPAWTDDPQRYTWAKAPRYDGQPAQTGPIALLASGADPVLRELLAREGDTVRVRALARLRRSAFALRDMQAQFEALFADPGAPLIAPAEPVQSGEGVAVVEAARGLLGHWLSIRDGRIAGYQVVTPTGWNASPRDGGAVPGPIEQALVGLPVQDGQRPILVEQVIRSFDPCLVCTVH